MAGDLRDFRPTHVIGLGVDTTGSTPLPVDRRGRPLTEQKKFSRNPNAMAWLWKDHTSVDEAAEITELASRIKPEYLAPYGGVYSSEWFFSKILRCARVDREVFEAATMWVEIADWIPALLTGTESPEAITVGRCASGHKAMFIWEDVTGRKTYLTGGIGAAGGHEGFAGPYDLPNFSAYCETCAGIANILWNERMFRLIR